MNERRIQSLLMDEMLRRRHVVAVPNSRYLSLSESDLLTVTKAGLIHEFEIKLSRADYLAEFRAPTSWKQSYRKTYKHRALKWAVEGAPCSDKTPNYYWFVTHGFTLEEDEVPEYAGWMEVMGDTDRYALHVHRKAPRLHTKSVTDDVIRKMARILSYRLMNEYKKRGRDVLQLFS